MDVSARTLGLLSLVTVTLGSGFIFFGDVVLTTIGVVSVLVGVISLLLATGTFLGQDGTDTDEPEAPST